MGLLVDFWGEPYGSLVCSVRARVWVLINCLNAARHSNADLEEDGRRKRSNLHKVRLLFYPSGFPTREPSVEYLNIETL